MANKWKYYGCFQPQPDCENRHFLDASPQHLNAPNAGQRFVQFTPPEWVEHVRFLVVVREPVSRSLSHYNMAIQEQTFPMCALGNTKINDGDKIPTFEEEVACDLERTLACFSKATLLTTSLRRVATKTSSSSKADMDFSQYYKCMNSLDVSHRDERGMTFSLIGRSLYAPQLRSWHAPALPEVNRKHVMVVDMKSVIEDTERTLDAIGAFYGIGSPGLNKLPEANSAADAEQESGVATQKTIDCDVLKQMEDFYKDWNAQLVTDMHASRAANQVPPQEPRFPGFAATSVECVSNSTKVR